MSDIEILNAEDVEVVAEESQAPIPMTAGEIRQDELEFCRNNIEYFFDEYGHIEDKDADELIQPFKMWKEQRKMSPWVHNKTIQKACESYRISDGQKEYLRTLKR